MRRTLVLMAMVAALPGVARAEDQVLSATVDGVDVKLWIPAGVKVLRGCLVNPADVKVGPGGPWAETLRPLGFAQMGLMIKDLNRGNRPTITRKAMEAAFQSLAAESGHPELPNLPLLYAGFSKGGGWSAGIAAMLPARSIAFASVCSWVSDAAKLNEQQRAIPGLFVIGAVPDGFKMLEAIPKLYDPGRQLNLPWTLALTWHCAHDYGNANAVVLPFFEAVVAARLPADADASKGPVALRPVKVEDGWLGDRGTWESNFATIAPYADYKGDKLAAVWLPNRYVAHAWRALMSRDAPLVLDAATADGRLTLPPDAPRTKRSLVVPQGADLVLTARPRRADEATPASAPASGPAAAVTSAPAAEPPAVAKVQFFDGDRLIGEAAAPPWTITWKAPPPGAHAVYAQWTTPAGQPAVTSPGLIVVSAAQP